MADSVTRGAIPPISVDAAGAGELLGVSERTVRDWTTEGILPSIDVGDHRNRLYSVEALRRWALERSGYHADEEVKTDDDVASSRPKALPAQGRKVAGRRPGRTRKPRASGAPLPVRLVER